MSISWFAGEYKQHSAALKYFRLRYEREGHNEGERLSTSRKAAVAAIVHPKGEAFHFVEEDMREWSWWELVAQMDDDSLEYVVCDGDRSRGLIACEVRPRPNSYDHKRQVQRTDVPQLREWDFVLIRSDETAVRLHPAWSNTKMSTFAVDGAYGPCRDPPQRLGEI